MRIWHRLGLVLASVVVPSFVHAQQQPVGDPRQSFNDSWYWGAKGGITQFNAGLGRVSAPTVGGEWLITRSRGAMYISAEQSFFDEVGGVFDGSVAGAVRDVVISDMRRYAVGLLAFPTSGSMRPYAGLGLAINVIQNADPQGTFLNEDSQTEVFQRVARQTSKVSAVLTAGLQLQAGRVAFFGQASSMPTRSDFLLSGANYTFVFEGGIRYNLANAIERLH